MPAHIQQAYQAASQYSASTGKRKFSSASKFSSSGNFIAGAEIDQQELSELHGNLNDGEFDSAELQQQSNNWPRQSNPKRNIVPGGFPEGAGIMGVNAGFGFMPEIDNRNVMSVPSLSFGAADYLDAAAVEALSANTRNWSAPIQSMPPPAAGNANNFGFGNNVVPGNSVFPQRSGDLDRYAMNEQQTTAFDPFEPPRYY